LHVISVHMLVYRVDRRHLNIH